MDIMAIDSDLFRSRYTWQGNDRNFTAEFSASDNEHWMSNYHLRRPPQDNMMTTGAMRYRRNWAVSENYGFKLQLEQLVDNGSWLYVRGWPLFYSPVHDYQSKCNAFLCFQFQ